MIETLILGFLLGTICTGAVAAYAAYRYLKQPYIIKQMSDGYEVIVIDKKFEKEDNSYLVLRKDGKIVSAIRFDKDGVKDAVHDIL